jgi:hypothetical protein
MSSGHRLSERAARRTGDYDSDDIVCGNYDVLRQAGRKESTRAQYKQTEEQWGV